MMSTDTPKAEYKEENLVVLSYGSNICCTEVADLKKFLKAHDGPNDIAVDLTAGRWTYKDEHKNSPDGSRGITGFDIGNSRYRRWGSQGGVIGVYDRTNINHLNLMLSASRSATEEPYHGDD